MFESFRVSVLVVSLAGLVLVAGPVSGGEELLGGTNSGTYESHGLNTPSHETSDTYSNARHHLWQCQQFYENYDAWGPDYVAGIDAWGRPVAPADIATSRGVLDGFDVVVDIPKNTTRRGRRNRTLSTEVVVDTSSGVVFAGDRPVSPSQLSDMRRNCRLFPNNRVE